MMTTVPPPRRCRMPPVVSVIIPHFSAERLLARALGSLFAQDLASWEAIIVDDGSPTESWGVVEAYSWLDPRIRAIRQTRAGVCAARNHGIATSTGEFLLFLDADDWLENDALSTLRRACENTHAAHGQFRYAMPDGNPTSLVAGAKPADDLFAALTSSNVLSVPACVMIRREALNRIGQFDPALVHCGDWDLWGRLARIEPAVASVEKNVANYRMSPGSLSRNPQTLLRDAITVLTRLHGRDTRVANASPRFLDGADMSQLPQKVGHFATYAAGLALASGNTTKINAVLETLTPDTTLSPQRVGEFLFYALCFSHCCDPQSIAAFWPALQYDLARLIEDIGRRVESEALPSRIWEQLAIVSDGRIMPAPILPSAPADQSPIADGWEGHAYDVLRSLAGRGN
jgi:hypothetical protein